MSNRRGTIHFWVAAGFLAASSLVLNEGKTRGWFLVIKKPLPLRASLEDFNQDSLRPWKLLSAGRLSAESEEELGTKEYMNWVVTDPNGTGERRRQIILTVTYYTGVQDQVPHVPEECVYQAGMAQAEPKTIIEWDLPRLGDRVEVARVVFDSPQRIGSRLFVYYTIAVNGEYRGDRDPVRIRMADPRDTHLYYSKVEVSIYSAPEAAVSALDEIGKDLMDRVLAELVRVHWPRKGWERGGPVGDAG
jgi:hypothetical protein